jgi:uncharacterized protein YbjT (DUF2867 family)
MNILITGANGFIGGYLVAHLLSLGHKITCAVRDCQKTQDRFPDASIIACDFNKDTDESVWLDRLENIDAVINCAGILTASKNQDIDAIHFLTPVALFRACNKKNIRRIIQISALGIANGPNIDYVTSKKKADDALMSLKVSACVIRPSLVYASGAYGGTALLRALAAHPFFIPIIGDGASKFCPIAMTDLVKIISQLLNNDSQGIVNAVGPNALMMKDILVAFRKWLGFNNSPVVSIPKALVKPVAKLGDFLGFKTVNTVSYEMTLHENIESVKPLEKHIDFKLTPFPQGLSLYPSQVQDRWHARLYFVRPLLKLSLILLWLFSGLIPLMGFNNQAQMLLHAINLPSDWIMPVIRITCLWDIILAIALCFSFKNQLIGLLQFVTVASYTLVASIWLPELWLNPLAPLLKNLPIMVAILMWMAIEKMR